MSSLTARNAISAGCARGSVVRFGASVYVLYMRAGQFACRHCQRVAYLSQSEDLMGRAWRKQRKVEARLGLEGERPKGMHCTAYERLCGILDRCEEMKDYGLFAVIQRLGLSCP